jgi:MoaA/NifB/PqqE/SkfB family radical SAM enzyme
MREEYSPFKIVHHLDKIQELKDGKQTVPLQVQIVPSNVCNQRCSFCAYRMEDYLSNQNFDERQMLSYDKIIETLDCFVEMGVKAVQYTGGGEPLVHPRIKDILRETFKRGLEVSLVTNGMALDDELCDILGDAAWVRVSVDCSSPDVYSFIRKVPNKMFDRTINNIKNLVKHRRTSIIGVGFVVEKENFHQIYDAAKLFKLLGVDNFRISAAFTPMGFEYFSTFLDEAKKLAKQAEGLSDDKFTVFNLFGDRVSDTFEGVQDYSFCPIKELLSYIGADYKVYTCCTLAYNDKGYIGSIKDLTFKEVWEGEQKTNMFACHDPSKMCKHPCMYKNKNDFINYCTKPNARHVNYI